MSLLVSSLSPSEIDERRYQHCSWLDTCLVGRAATLLALELGFALELELGIGLGLLLRLTLGIAQQRVCTDGMVHGTGYRGRANIQDMVHRAWCIIQGR